MRNAAEAVPPTVPENVSEPRAAKRYLSQPVSHTGRGKLNPFGNTVRVAPGEARRGQTALPRPFLGHAWVVWALILSNSRGKPLTRLICRKIKRTTLYCNGSRLAKF